MVKMMKTARQVRVVCVMKNLKGELEEGKDKKLRKYQGHVPWSCLIIEELFRTL